jgi:hypothetical protein
MATKTIGILIFEKRGAQYTKDYRRGFKESESVSTTGLSLDDAERRPGAGSDAWMDGWLDAGTGRDFGHLAFCENHHNDEGGCGVA